VSSALWARASIASSVNPITKLTPRRRASRFTSFITKRTVLASSDQKPPAPPGDFLLNRNRNVTVLFAILF
jgi:hypothetical protein